MAQTLTETPHVETAEGGPTAKIGTEPRILHVPGFLDRFVALAGTAAARDGSDS